MIRLLLPAALLALSPGAHGQHRDEDGSGRGATAPRWGLGVAALASDSPFAGEGARIMPVPLLSYEGERFSWRGVAARWRLLEGASWELSAVGQVRFDGFEVDDLGRRELAANGIDARLLEDRDEAFDLGLGLTWRGAAGELEVDLLSDATDTSGGQEVSVEYGYQLEAGRAMLTPGVGLTWMSDDLADYYYGTLDAEVGRGVVDYRPGSVTIPHIGMSYFRPLGARWALVGELQYSVLPDAITDSPLIEPDTEGMATLFVGASRGF